MLLCNTLLPFPLTYQTPLIPSPSPPVCPSCSNMLTILPHPTTNQNSFQCPTCPYQMPLSQKFFERKTYAHAQSAGETGEILGGEESWKNVDRTDGESSRARRRGREVHDEAPWCDARRGKCEAKARLNPSLTWDFLATCPKCEAKQAYFRQVQIRSADEPMTSFYRCVQCANEWREG